MWQKLSKSYQPQLELIPLALLALGANLLSALLALATLVIYLVVYTPMKRHSALATLVGAVSGALPPLIGAPCLHWRSR